MAQLFYPVVNSNDLKNLRTQVEKHLKSDDSLANQKKIAENMFAIIPLSVKESQGYIREMIRQIQ
jgi:hypothetical protein